MVLFAGIFVALFTILALVYVTIPSRIYMRGQDLLPNIDPNLTKRIAGVLMLVVAFVLWSALLGR